MREMVQTGKCNRGKLEFANRGRRISGENGLYYPSACSMYALYKGDRLCGVGIKPARWVAFNVTNGVCRVISRHFSRKSAEQACEKFDKSHFG